MSDITDDSEASFNNATHVPELIFLVIRPELSEDIHTFVASIIIPGYIELVMTAPDLITPHQKFAP